IAFELSHQHRLGAVLDRREGEAPRDVDRGPERQALVKTRHRGLVGEITERDQLDPRIGSVREVLGLRVAAVGHVAGRAGVKERAGDRDAERAGSPGDHYMTVAKIHYLLLKLASSYLYTSQWASVIT